VRLILIILLSFWPLAIIADESNAGSRLSELLDADADGFAKALTPREFSFPRDHGPHPEFRNEWWYITGNLDDESGRRFGFEFTVFRFSLTPDAPEQDSAWRSNQVYIAHLALTDADRDQFKVAERFSRGAVGLAGAQAEPFRVWIDDWELASDGDGDDWRLRASGDDFELDLELRPLKEPVLNGERGLSRKSSTTDSASYYYSITRLGTEGQLSIAGEEHAVSGLSWLDREWSTSALAPDQVGWDWFSLQLADGTDLMLYNIRKTDGTADEKSSGTITFANGDSRGLNQDEFVIVVNDTWDSPEGGAYPSNWKITVPAQGLEIEIVPVIADQELFTTVRYWEGAVDVSGTRRGQPVTGRGYVELTGYAD
jgi:predicted secreted hydrolase